MAQKGHNETGDTALLSVVDLNICFSRPGGTTPITRDVSFTVDRGECVGMVGESGCGKTVTGLALLGLLPQRTARVRGEISFEGRDLTKMPARALRKLRGREISMIFQEPMSALDPVFTVGQQLIETLRSHERIGRKAARERAIAALDEVGIPSPGQRIDDYPYQFSGGMRQRVMIAIALICRPKLVIADEPTTALDVTIQAQILDLLREISDATGTALLFISHDLGVITETCSRILTMYAGEVVETAPVDDLLHRPGHPYSSGLLRSLPELSARGERLPFIPGRVPPPELMPDGCRFQERCPHALDGCEQRQDLSPFGDDRQVRCWRKDELHLTGAVAS